MHLSVDKDLVVQKDVWTISGGVYTNFMAPGGAHYPSGFVNTPDGVSPRPAESPLLEPLLMIYRPFDPTVGGFVDLADRFHLVEGRYVAQGRECVLLVENKNPDITTSLFLDPERDFVVMAMMRQHQGAELYRLAFDEYKRSGGDWVPVRWTSTFYGANGSVGTRDAISVTRFDINGPSDRKEFELEFPPGTWAHDKESGSHGYIAKEGGKKRLITRPELASGATYEDFLETDTGMLDPNRDPKDDDDATKRLLRKIRTRRRGALEDPYINYDGIEVRLKAAPERPDSEQDDEGEVPLQQPLRVAIDEVSCDHLLFGDWRNEPSARDHIESCLQRRIESIDGICRLTEVQTQKLDLAGRSDIKRLFEQVDELKPRLRTILSGKHVRELEPAALKLCRDSDPVRRAFISGPFGDGSSFAKTLKLTLTAEQTAALDEASGGSDDN